jgi:hypothetical protein
VLSEGAEDVLDAFLGVAEEHGGCGVTQAARRGIRVRSNDFVPTPLQLGRAEVAVGHEKRGAIRVGKVGSDLVLVHDENQLAIATAVDDLSRGYCSDGAVGSVLARAWSRVK